MPQFSTFLAVLVAGSFLPLQNALMSAMVSRGVPHAAAVALNYAGSFAAATAFAFASSGLIAHQAIARTWSWWYALPGFIGAAAAVTTLAGFRYNGALLTVVALICGQLLAGVLMDGLGVTGPPKPLTGQAIVGLLLVGVGAVLVLRSRFAG